MADVIAGRVQLIDPLARGASGSLWRAVDRRYAALTAAKVMRQRDGADVLRFVREQSAGAGTGRGVGRQAHILLPYSWVAEDDAVVLLMPLMHGGTLGDALRENGALHPLLVTELTRQLLDALAAVHASGWLHRDVKPANLLLAPTGSAAPHLRLADFGIALRHDDARLTSTGLVNGTTGYMAPELLSGATPEPEQDVWAAGAVALRLLAPTLRAEHGAAALVAQAIPDFSAPQALALRHLLEAMLAEDPARRPTAAAARDAMAPASGPPPAWVLTARGTPFQVNRHIEPLPATSPEALLPEIPVDGPELLGGRGDGLHDRLARAATSPPQSATPPPRPAVPSPTPTPTPRPVARPTVGPTMRTDSASPPRPAPTASAVRPPTGSPVPYAGSAPAAPVTHVAAAGAARPAKPMWPVPVLAAVSVLSLGASILLGILAARG